MSSVSPLVFILLNEQVDIFQAPALFRMAQLSKMGVETFLAKKLALRYRTNPSGVRGFTSMGLLDSLLGSGLKGGRGRDYSDLKPGDFPAETAVYASNNEVKSVSKVCKTALSLLQFLLMMIPSVV